jgi:hypothetical protein
MRIYFKSGNVLEYISVEDVVQLVKAKSESNLIVIWEDEKVKYVVNTDQIDYIK